MSIVLPDGVRADRNFRSELRAAQLRRGEICVNLCAGIPSELLATPAFRAMIERAAKVMQEGSAEPVDVLTRDAIGEIEAIIEGVLRKHGIVLEQEQRKDDVFAHQHTMSCYDDRGELLCGRAAAEGGAE